MRIFARRCLIIAGAGLVAAPLQALEIDASLEYGAYYTDNTAQTENDTVGEWVQEPGFRFGASHDTATLQLDSAYEYRRQIHEEDLFSDQNITTGSSSLLWTLVENRLDFTARNTRAQATRQARGGTNPDNLQVVSTTEIGPTLRLQPRSGDELQIEYRYLQDTRDSTNDDSQRNNGTLRYLVGLSPNRNIVLESTYSDISYDNRDDATQTTGTIGYQQSGGSVDFVVNVGYSNFDGDNSDSTSGAIFNTDITWAVSGSSSLSFDASRAIQDRSGEYYDPTDFEDPIAGNSDTNAVYTLTDGGLTWDQALGQRTNLSFRVSASDEDYESDIDDNTRYGARIGLTRELTRSTSLRAAVDYSYRDYDLDNDDQKEYTARFDVSHALGRRLTFSWGASYQDRDADTSESYKEAIFNLNLAYQILGSR